MADERNIADEFAYAYIAYVVDLLRSAEGIRELAILLLEDLQADIERQIRNADVMGVSRTAFRIRRQEELIRRADATISTAYRKLNTRLRAESVKLAEIAEEALVNLTNKVIGVDLLTPLLSETELRIIATDTDILGAPASDWWKKQAADLRQRFATQIRMGVAAGESMDQITSRIIGRATGRRRVVRLPDGGTRRIAERAGGIMDISKREATALVRTAVQTISNKVHEATWQENKGLLEGRQALVTLDSRTTDLCKSRSGAAWDMNGKPFPDSPVKIPFPGPPPWHWNCRTLLIPVLKSWEKLVKEATGKKMKIAEIAKGTQSSMDGQVAGDLTYERWLKSKSVPFQKEVLGPGKWDLWNSGKITFADLVDPTGRSLTLDELRARFGR